MTISAFINAEIDANAFDDLYMVRSASTHEPVGFVGWQKRYVAPHNVGYYAIGVLPEYRKQGMAKAAVAEMLAEKAAEVDLVKAFIMPHNAPSLALAESLHIPVVKDASTKTAINVNAILNAAKFIDRAGAGAMEARNGMVAGGENLFRAIPQAAKALGGAALQKGGDIIRDMGPNSPYNPLRYIGHGMMGKGIGTTLEAERALEAGGSAGAGLNTAQKFLRKPGVWATGALGAGGIAGAAGFNHLMTTGGMTPGPTAPSEDMKSAASILAKVTTKSAGLGGEAAEGIASKVLPMLYRGVKNPMVQGAVGNALTWDAFSNHDHYGDMNAGRAINMGINGAVGAMGGHLMSKGNAPGAIGTWLMSPLKDLIVNSIPVVNKLPGTMDRINNSLDHPAAPAQSGGGMTGRNLALGLAGGLGIGGLGYLGARSISKAINHSTDEKDKGRIRLKLPTKDPNDHETSVDLPIRDFGLSPTLMGAIGRDTRRRLRQESKSRTWHRNPQGHLITHGESVDDTALANSMAQEQGGEDLPKAAAFKEALALV